MYIKINNEQDEKRFLFLLPVYKLFVFTKFETNSNDKQIKMLINGLNIKNRKKRIIFMYDEICNYVDNFYKDKNICEFHNDKCINQCNNSHKMGCCRMCKYKARKCPTKNLTCKLFYCSNVRDKYKTIDYNDLKALKIFSYRQRLIIKSNYFTTREDFIRDLNYIGIIIPTIKMLYRLLVGILILKEEKYENSCNNRKC